MAADHTTRNRLKAPVDCQITQMWLHGKSPATRKTYLKDIQSFLDFSCKRLENVTIADIQDWDTSLELEVEPATRKRKLSAITAVIA